MRINLDPSINPKRDNIVIAVDSTGIKVTNRGQWILDKWKHNRRIRKGFIDTRSSRHKDKKDSINECNKRRCLRWKNVKRSG